MQSLLQIEKIVGKRKRNKNLEYLACCDKGYAWINIKQLKYNLQFVQEFENQANNPSKIQQILDNFDINMENSEIKQEQVEEQQQKRKQKQQKYEFNNDDIILENNKQQQIQYSGIEVRKRKRYDQFM